MSTIKQYIKPNDRNDRGGYFYNKNTGTYIASTLNACKSYRSEIGAKLFFIENGYVQIENGVEKITEEKIQQLRPLSEIEKRILKDEEVRDGIIIPDEIVEKDQQYFNSEIKDGISRRYYKGRVLRGKLIHADKDQETFRKLCPECGGHGKKEKIVCFSCRGTGAIDQIFKIPIMSPIEIRADIYRRIKEKYVWNGNFKQIAVLDWWIVEENIDVLIKRALT